MWKHVTSSKPWHPTPKAKPIRRRQPPPATPRHPNHSLPLLPSGPGGVCKLSSRGNRRRSPLKSGVQITVESKSCKRQSRAPNNPVAEREGFEPSIRGLAVYTLSRRAPSAARTPLHWIGYRCALAQSAGVIIPTEGRAEYITRLAQTSAHPLANRAATAISPYFRTAISPHQPACCPDATSRMRHRRSARFSRSAHAV